MEPQQIYKFHGIPELHCDLKGNFFYNNKPVTKVYNTGTAAILINGSKRGLVKLRKLAYKTTINSQDLTNSSLSSDNQ